MYIILYWCEAQQTSSNLHRPETSGVWEERMLHNCNTEDVIFSLQHNLSCCYQPVHIKSTVIDTAIYTRRLVESEHASSCSTLLYNMIMSTDTMYQLRKYPAHYIYSATLLLLDMAVTIEQRCINRTTTPPASSTQQSQPVNRLPILQASITPWSTPYEYLLALRSNTPFMAACKPLHISCTLSRDRQYAAYTDHYTHALLLTVNIEPRKSYYP